jgi:hypothetical protein
MVDTTGPGPTIDVDESGERIIRLDVPAAGEGRNTRT